MKRLLLIAAATLTLTACTDYSDSKREAENRGFVYTAQVRDGFSSVPVHVRFGDTTCIGTVAHYDPWGEPPRTVLVAQVPLERGVIEVTIEDPHVSELQKNSTFKSCFSDKFVAPDAK